MELSGLKKIVLESNAFSSFNPMQEKALPFLFEKNVVVSAPTASGKTLLAELASLNSIINRKQKVVYTAPLRALAFEHFRDFREKYSKKLNIRIAISTGDIDSSGRHLSNYDLIFTTFEKLDSLQRHNADWLKSVGLLVVDEVHELDSNRGATLEMGISKFLFINPKIQLLALSATIPNAKELAEWLGTELVESSYRPIPLKEGIYFNGEINYGKDVEEIGFEKNELHSIAKNTFLKKKQALIFANTRKRAESIAFQLSKLAESHLSESDRKNLEKGSEKILKVLELPTEQCKRLSEMVKHGTAFHHAGLLNGQRKIIEDLFKQNYLKLLSATPTLSAGVNLPSHTVVLSSCYRYGVNGMEPLAVREIKQMLGRAGRPKYDSEGRGVLIARNELETGELLENYINGEIESISSKLGIMPVLRMHLLSLISSNYVFGLKSCEKFFSKTFYAKQFDSLSELFGKISEILDELKEMSFVEEVGGNFRATVLGKRVSELYLDPLSAFEMINSLKKEMAFSEQSYLFLLTQSFEFSPWLSVSKKNEAELWEALELEKKQLPCDIEREMFFDLNLLKKFNSSKALKGWINEVREETILENFNLQPGILHSKLEICDWLCYSALELSNLLELKKHFEPLAKLRKRLKHGIKEELIHLTELKGIGRVRGRKLYNAGIKGIADLKKTDSMDLSKILGQKIAESVKKELGQ